MSPIPYLMRRAGLFVAGAVFAAGAAATEIDAYYLRAATEDLAVFHQLARDGALTRADVQADLNFGPRFEDADVNRDGVVTAEEMHAYVERAYGIAVSSSTGSGTR